MSDRNWGDKRPVVFLDRDGTLNKEVGYIRKLEDLELIPGAADAMRKLNAAGVAAILITNQSGAARGYYPEDHIKDLNDRLVKLLGENEARLDAVYYCPHLPDGAVAEYTRNCQCRKPETGLCELAYVQVDGLDRERAYVVGDKSTDVDLAKNLQAKGLLVKTGYGQQVLDGKYQWLVSPDAVVDDIQKDLEE
jgi:D-glycero-D-manno-heptose 1,7-bisphosphate phosphatase